MVFVVKAPQDYICSKEDFDKLQPLDWEVIKRTKQGNQIKPLKSENKKLENTRTKLDTELAQIKFQQRALQERVFKLESIYLRVALADEEIASSNRPNAKLEDVFLLLAEPVRKQELFRLLDSCGNAEQLLNMTNAEDDYPIHVAIRNNCSPDVISFLLRKGASLSSQTCWGATPLELAKKLKNKELISLLEANTIT